MEPRIAGRSADEFEPVRPTDPIRQGDVVVSLDERSDYVALIIVTADCDLKYNKFGGRLTALPVVELGEYLRDFWLLKELGVQRDQLAGQIQAEMSELVDSSPNEIGEPTSERLLAWALESESGEIADVLGVPRDQLARVHQLSTMLRRVDEALAGGLSLRATWRTCCDAMFANNMKSLEKARSALKKRVARELPRQLPGDVLYLNQPLPGGTSGFVALARFPVEINPGEIALGPADEVYGQAIFRRVSRLASPFRYRLTQLFAEVYSAIGLPSDYELARLDHFECLAEELDRELWN